MKQLLFFLIIVFSFISCNSQNDCENVVDISKVKADVKLVRLEKELFNANSPNDVRDILKKHPLAAKYIIGANPDDTVATGDIYRLYTHPAFREFYEKGEKDNDHFADLQPSIENMVKHVKYYYPKYHIPEIFTLMTGLEPTKPGTPTPDIVIVDSLVIGIGIDYFYGPKAKHRPSEYDYMLDRRKPYFIVPGMALKIAQEDFVYYDENDRTMLAEMVKWGKAHYFVKRVMPCLPDSIVIGYTSEQINSVEQNMNVIWSHFISNELFYKTDIHEIQRYVGESPKVQVIGEKCPGRIGRYIGWQIVKAYMERNPEVTLPQLMQDVDAKKIFMQSKYKPKSK